MTPGSVTFQMTLTQSPASKAPPSIARRNAPEARVTTSVEKSVRPEIQFGPTGAGCRWSLVPDQGKIAGEPGGEPGAGFVSRRSGSNVIDRTGAAAPQIVGMGVAPPHVAACPGAGNDRARAFGAGGSISRKTPSPVGSSIIPPVSRCVVPQHLQEASMTGSTPERCRPSLMDGPCGQTRSFPPCDPRAFTAQPGHSAAWNCAGNG